MIHNKEITDIINTLVEPNEVVFSEHLDWSCLYVITVDKSFIGHEDDDRYHTTGGKGPIKVDLGTKHAERISYLEFPDHFKREEKEPDLDQIKEDIIRRKWINERDVFYFTEHLDHDKNLYEIYDISDIVGIRSNDNSVIQSFTNLFDELGCKFNIREVSHIQVDRELSVS